MIDEVVLAGGEVEGNTNNSYYLASNFFYHTMSYAEMVNYEVGRMWSIQNNVIGSHDNATAETFPIINLSKDVTIASGNGSKENPYIFELS